MIWVLFYNTNLKFESNFKFLETISLVVPEAFEESTRMDGADYGPTSILDRGGLAGTYLPSMTLR